LALRYQNYTGKAIFMPPSIGVGIVIIDFLQHKDLHQSRLRAGCVALH
jgi:hypothetical protein